MKTYQCVLSTLIFFLISACYSTSNETSALSTKDQYLVISGGNIITMQGSMAEAKTPDKYIFDQDYSLLVKNDLIQAIAKTSAIVSMIPKGKRVDYLDLKGQTLLPGFIEPHAHLQLTVAAAKLTNLMACLPDKYQIIFQKDYAWLNQSNDMCLLYIEDAINILAKSEPMGCDLTSHDSNVAKQKGKQTEKDCWLVGNGLDPSRMMLTQQSTSLNDNREFLNYPARYFVEYDEVFKHTPAFILDQSGHLAYVNSIAFEKAGICKKVPCIGTKAEMEKAQKDAAESYGFTDGEWGIVQISEETWGFSGLLKEESAFYPFLGSLFNEMKGLPDQQQAAFSEQMKLDMLQVLNIASQQGVTTFTEGGGSSQQMIEAYKQIANMPDMPTRLRTLYTWNIKLANKNKLADKKAGKNNDKKSKVSSKVTNQMALPEKIPFEQGLFSAEGVKLWADGSTQGCSASLTAPYSEAGLCKAFGKGHQNYTATEMKNHLEKYAKNGWYAHIHANGDAAISDAIEALADLANENVEFKQLPSVIIHSTVNGVSGQKGAIPQQIITARSDSLPNLSTSHLMGHVAYWGASLKNELGQPRADFIDPTQTEWALGIPLSLHSDMTITPLYPLWFVEQAITRNTWTYPNLTGEGQPLNASEALTPYQALMAVTIHPAMQHNIADKVGSLEVGKLADLVVLAKNPMKEAKTDIHDIAVSCTFLNGERVVWQKPDNANRNRTVINTPNCKIAKAIEVKQINIAGSK